MSHIAVIPARGGSKRIPRKNIRDFCGRPMLAYPIDAAMRTKMFDAIYVSTDDDEIACIAKRCGATVLHRPDSLSDDATPTVPVIAHAIESISASAEPPEYTTCLYPATPLLSSHDLVEAWNRLQETNVDYAVAVTPFGHPIERALFVDRDGNLEMVDPSFASLRTQDIEPRYHDAGAFYVGRSKAWLRETPLLGSSSIAIVLPRHRCVDIDEPDDWTLAEQLYEVGGNGERAS